MVFPALEIFTIDTIDSVKSLGLECICMSAEQKPEILHIDNTPELTVIYGPMFSGKSTQLADRMRVYDEELGYKVLLVKPSIDNRYSEDKVVSHSGLEYGCCNADIAAPEQIIAHVLEAERDGTPVEIVGIDEAQFFTEGIVDVIDELLAHGKRVYVAGLPTTFNDEEFGSMGEIIAKADVSIHRTAMCMYQETPDSKKCGKPATKTQRIINGVPADYDSPIILIGAQQEYQARCRTHHIVPGKPEKHVVYEASNEKSSENGSS